MLLFHLGKWDHDPSHRSTINKSRQTVMAPHTLPLCFCTTSSLVSAAVELHTELAWAWHVSQIVQQKGGFSLILLRALDQSAQQFWPRKLGSMQLGGRRKALPLPAAYVCAGWQGKSCFSPLACRAISKHKIYTSAATWHQCHRGCWLSLQEPGILTSLPSLTESDTSISHRAGHSQHGHQHQSVFTCGATPHNASPIAFRTRQESHQQEPVPSEFYLLINLYFASGKKPEWLSANS